MRGGPPAVEDAGRGKHEAADAHRAHALAFRSASGNPFDQLCVPGNVLDHKRSGNDKCVDLGAIERADRLSDKRHAVCGVHLAAVRRDDGALIVHAVAPGLAEDRSNAESFERSAKIKNRNAWICGKDDMSLLWH